MGLLGSGDSVVDEFVASVLNIAPCVLVVTYIVGDDTLFAHLPWHFHLERHCADCFHPLPQLLDLGGVALWFNSCFYLNLQHSAQTLS